MDERDFDLCDLLAHPISTGEFIASTIFLLADNQKARQTGRRTIEAQILLNKKLTKAIVSVTRFATPASRLERVR